MNKTKRLAAADREPQIKSELPVCGMKQESEEVLASAGPGEGLPEERSEMWTLKVLLKYFWCSLV